ncbi:uncharacterized protein PFL1_00094 [Pseudozyma flocculosa PF-1]|uniref:Uncharacterized protein n=1 Tax=Pseudozyma flocculosa TaxID=84751 RepID=A0A5C3EUH6_9BASI|nr:uncharacterized protein PFL1_00094 [Pseudozyma flocculosa PF-1]EPQ31895.1 hypothetical protein PFL1_00094 [Pseudozyma flocculosa PF-1]SPO35196.1 uncharacterized protein PSFLO_00667 [Pseudozyma flocculosa]
MGLASTVRRWAPSTWNPSEASSSSSPATSTVSSAGSTTHDRDAGHHRHHRLTTSKKDDRDSSSRQPEFYRARKYRPPPTSFHSSIQAIQEEFGSPRTSKEVKQAYLDSLNPSDNEDFSSPATSAPPSPRNPLKTMAPSHSHGTAAEQGAALREAAERETGIAAPQRKGSARVRRSMHSSPRTSVLASPHESPRASHRKLHYDDDDNEEQHHGNGSRHHGHGSPRYSHAHDGSDTRASSRRQSRRVSRDVDAVPEPGSAAAQGAAVRRGEKPTGPSKERMLIAQQRALRDDRSSNRDQPDIGRGSAPKPPVYPMTGIDNLALLMEDDGYTTSCFSIYMFKSELDLDTVDNFFEVLAKTYPKYRYVVDLDPKESKRIERQQAKATYSEKSTKEERKFDPGRRTRYGKGLKAGTLFRSARWRFVPDFDIKDNISQADAAAPGDDAALNKLAGQFLGRHYDYSKPIWEALVVNGLHTADGGRSALMIKIHHCFSDGQGMIQSYHAALGALEQGIGIRDIQRKVDSNQGVKKPGQREAKPSVWGTTKHVAHTARGLYFRKRKAFTYEEKRKERPVNRLYCHSEGIGMDDIKLIRKAFSTEKVNLTLNDVACAILARALRIAAERTAKNGVVKDKRVAVFVPISVRERGDWSLSNRTTGTVAWFRFEKEQEGDIEQQLLQVNREMNRIKGSYLPKMWFKVFDLYCKRRITYMPNYPGFRQFFYRAFGEYHVATNVPGPAKPVKFGQHEAYSYHVLPPSSPGKATMAVGMISYANDFSLAVSCDDVPEFDRLPEEICRAFQDSARDVIQAARTKMGKEK